MDYSLEVCCRKTDVTFPLHIRFKGQEESFCGLKDFNWKDMKHRWNFNDDMFCTECNRISTLIENL